MAALFEWTETVRPEWIDYNGHMNVAHYVAVFDHATEAFHAVIGVDDAYRRAGDPPRNASPAAAASSAFLVLMPPS